MKNIFASTIFLLGSFLSADAFAEKSVNQFECDTPSGHFSSWKTAYAAKSVRISGTIAVSEIRNDAQSFPGAHVYLYSGDGKSLVGLILSIDKNDQTKLNVSAVERGGRKLDEVFSSVAWKDRDITFQVVALSSGAIVLSVDGISHKINVPGNNIGAVGLRCTSGDFLFTTSLGAP